jgi:hypothetical protein
MGKGIVACLTPSGARTWATTTDADLMKALTSDDLVGRAAAISGGTITVD